MLQKSFCTGDQKFCGLQARLSRKDVRDLIASRKSTGDFGAKFVSPNGQLKIRDFLLALMAEANAELKSLLA